MNWQLCYRDAFNFSIAFVDSISIPITFLTPSLIVGINNTQGKDYVGRLVPYLFVDGFGFVRLEPVFLYAGYQALAMNNSNQYRVAFKPDKKLLGCELSIFRGSMPLFNQSQSNNRSDTTKPTTVAAATQATVLIEANPERKGATIVNDSSSTLFLHCGEGASNTKYTAKVAANSYYELPYGYAGIVSGVWGLATGKAIITEFM